jgi:tRNA-dihydrouridine synthase
MKNAADPTLISPPSSPLTPDSRVAPPLHLPTYLTTYIHTYLHKYLAYLLQALREDVVVACGSVATLRAGVADLQTHMVSGVMKVRPLFSNPLL